MANSPKNSGRAPLHATNRRTFLTNAAALAGAGVGFSGSSALGASDERVAKRHTTPRVPLAEGETMRIAVIGTGGMGSGHCGAIVTQAKNGEYNAQIVAVCDVAVPRAERMRAKLSEDQGIEVTAYQYHEDVLARDDIHGVLIATPEHWHATMVTDAIMAGKDVYVEKPMTLSIEDALWLKRLMEVNDDMICQVGTQYMMYEKYVEARRLIAEGAIGKPIFSQTSYCRNSKEGEWLYGIDPELVPGEKLDWERWCGPMGTHEWDTEVYHRWRRYRTWSTGIIGDLLVHMTTPLIYALGGPWPVRVCASGGHYKDKAMENHDQVNINLEFETEHVMNIVGSTCNEQGLEVMIRGHEANLYLGSNNVVLRPERVFSDDVDELTVQCKSISPQHALRADWMNSIRTREENRSTVEFACKVMVMVDLATRSMWDKKAWAFDPKTLKASSI
ncbi:MAG: putative dehydrogenase [Planctomycetota bacterium]|jgi:predicted dehydrogenase